MRWARLFSGFTVYHDNARLPAWPPSVPAGPAGSPPGDRRLGRERPSPARSRRPCFFASTVPTAGRTAYWEPFITDVAATVRCGALPRAASPASRYSGARR